MINIILCDASLEGLQHSKELLRSCPSIRIAATAIGDNQLLQLLQKGVDAEMIVLDINLPFTNTLTLIKCIKKTYPAYKILIHTLSDNLEWITLAITFGADGFLYKRDVVPSFMEEAITQISEVGYHANLIVTKGMFDKAKKQKAKLPKTGLFGISKKEEEVLKLLQTDKSSKEIAQMLSLETRTVEWHIGNIYGKLGVTTRAGAIEVGSFKKHHDAE